MTETWRTIKGFEGKYSVSNLGSVRNDRFNRTLKPTFNTRGYLHVCIYKNKIRKCERVHCLVAQAFLGERPSGLDINHKDLIKTNNRVSNLEYITRRENIRHAWDNGACINSVLNGSRYNLCLKGVLNGSSKLTEEQVLSIRKEFDFGGITKKELARRYEVTDVMIGKIIRREKWKHI